MKKIILTLCMIFGATVVLFAQGWRKGEMEVQVTISDKYVAKDIADLGLSCDYNNGKVVVYATPSELKKIEKITNNYKILKEDMNAWAEQMKGSREAYHSYDEIIALADSLEEHFPNICKKYIFGTSIQNRQLAALKISDNVAIDEPEAEVMFDGGIHGDEIGAAENVIRFARDLCLEYGQDYDITNLINSREIWLYLMVNPDGRVNMSRYNASGIDLNRDWPFMWDEEGFSKGPASQPETKALRNCAYNNQFVIHTTYHSGTEYISCPWSYRPDPPADLTTILHLAEIYADESFYYGIEFGQGCTGMYPINGSSKDFNYGALGSVSWSMEISYDKQPPASQIMEYYGKNKSSMIAMIEYSGYGIEGIITDEVTGKAVQAAVLVEDYYPCYSDPEVGDYHKFILPGTYSLVVKANGYEDTHVDNINIEEKESTVVNISMTPVDGAKYVCKYAGCQIPDISEYADEGNVPAIIGAPDNLNYSVGENGWIVFDMQEEILNMVGDEITIYEGDDTPEGYTLFAGHTIDGPWVSLGEGEGTASFDLSSGNMTKARFFKLLDDGDGSPNVNDAGFDFDAAENITLVSDLFILLDDFSIAETNGNNNGIPEPGETLSLSLSLHNFGIEMASGVVGTLECFNPDVTISEPQQTYGYIISNGVTSRDFTIQLSEQMPEQEQIFLTLDINEGSGTYKTTINISFVAGVISDDFETNDFSVLPWEFDGYSDWITTSPGNESDFCATSGDLPDQQYNSLIITADILSEGDISFNTKVSSEENYDFLQFYIDYNLIEQWSGFQDWSHQSYSIATGQHHFMWKYVKDWGESQGSDRGWIDNITFPAVSFNKEGSVQGIITDAQSGDSLREVEITAMHQSMDFLTSGYTDEYGCFYMNSVPEGEYEFCYVKNDYVTYCETAFVNSGESLTLNVQLQQEVGIDDVVNSYRTLLFPNPVSEGSVTITIPNEISEKTTLSVLNTSGIEIFKMNLNSGDKSVHISDATIRSLPQGLYTIRIIDGNTLYISKLIKL